MDPSTKNLEKDMQKVSKALLRVENMEVHERDMLEAVLGLPKDVCSHIQKFKIDEYEPARKHIMKSIKDIKKESDDLVNWEFHITEAYRDLELAGGDDEYLQDLLNDWTHQHAEHVAHIDDMKNSVLNYVKEENKKLNDYLELCTLAILKYF